MEPEDETFKKLSRVSFEEMMRIFNDWKEPISGPKSISEFLERHKWTYEEYLQEMIKKDGIY